MKFTMSFHKLPILRARSSSPATQKYAITLKRSFKTCEQYVLKASIYSENIQNIQISRKNSEFGKHFESNGVLVLCVKLKLAPPALHTRHPNPKLKHCNPKSINFHTYFCSDVEQVIQYHLGCFCRTRSFTSSPRSRVGKILKRNKPNYSILNLTVTAVATAIHPRQNSCEKYTDYTRA